MERDDAMAGPGQNSPSESTPPQNERPMEFVRGSDLDEWEDMLIAAAKRVVERHRAQGLLPEQQKPGK